MKGLSLIHIFLDDDLLVLVSPHILAVDLCPCKLALAQCANVEIVIEDARCV